LVGVKLGVVLFVIGVGVWYVNSANWTSIPPSARKITDTADLLHQRPEIADLVPESERHPAPDGETLLKRHPEIANVVSPEEVKRPQRDVPFGILASLVVCTVLYLAVAAVLTGIQPYPEIDPDAGVAVAFKELAAQRSSLALKLSAGLIAAGALAGITSVIL